MKFSAPPWSRRAALLGAGSVALLAACGRKAAAPSAKLGTGHGAREWSRVTLVNFQRATSSPEYVYRVEYDSQARLMASASGSTSWLMVLPEAV